MPLQDSEGVKGFAGHDWIEYNVDLYAMPDAV